MPPSLPRLAHNITELSSSPIFTTIMPTSALCAIHATRFCTFQLYKDPIAYPPLRTCGVAQYRAAGILHTQRKRYMQITRLNACCRARGVSGKGTFESPVTDLLLTAGPEIDGGFPAWSLGSLWVGFGFRGVAFKQLENAK